MEGLIVGSPNSGTPLLQYPKTNEEVKWRQMDIIYFLAQHGVPTGEKDSAGQTPSDKAAMLDEINFMEGSLLLGVHLYCLLCVIKTLSICTDILTQKQANTCRLFIAHQSDPPKKENRGNDILDFAADISVCKSSMLCAYAHAHVCLYLCLFLQ